MAKPVYILNGPNLNMLGTREPEIYGSQTLDDLARICKSHASKLGIEVDFRQSNSESDLIDWIQEARSKASGVVLNAAAYTHTSVAIPDAVAAAGVPVIEVHLSNIFRRETFRHHSYISPVANGVICGFGVTGYRLALDAISAILQEQSNQA